MPQYVATTLKWVSINVNVCTYRFQISECGLVMDEKPGKVSEAFRLFLQGEGYGKRVLQRRPTTLDLSPIDEQQCSYTTTPSSSISYIFDDDCSVQMML